MGLRHRNPPTSSNMIQHLLLSCPKEMDYDFTRQSPDTATSATLTHRSEERGCSR